MWGEGGDTSGPDRASPAPQCSDPLSGAPAPGRSPPTAAAFAPTPVAAVGSGHRPQGTGSPSANAPGGDKCFPYILLGVSSPSHQRRITPGSVNPLQVALVEPVAYPSAQLKINGVRHAGPPVSVASRAVTACRWPACPKPRST